MTEAENEVIGRVLAGDRDAFGQLVASHYQFAFRIAFRITGDASDAEEVAQEAFLRAYIRLSTFRQDASFSTWVNRITMNTAINLVERRNRELTHLPQATAGAERTDPLQTLADRGAGPERLLLDGEAASLREAAMATLTPMERTAFTLRHMEDVPLAEIAEALRVPTNSVKQAVFRAVGKLRRSLQPAVGGTR